MDENRGKIRDKGTITKIVGHKFAEFSLEDQSRAKINMLLEIVHSMMLVIPKVAMLNISEYIV